MMAVPTDQPVVTTALPTAMFVDDSLSLRGGGSSLRAFALALARRSVEDFLRFFLSLLLPPPPPPALQVPPSALPAPLTVVWISSAAALAPVFAGASVVRPKA